MGLEPGTPISEIPVDVVFIGSCTNGRIEDLRAAARVSKGRKIAPGVQALVVPGSEVVRHQAEAEGLDRIFLEAGAEWRQAGCSMCLAMNPDKLKPGQRSASTSNRNFEGRQGPGGRTHLVSPAMAAAAAVTGHFTDVRRAALIMIMEPFITHRGRVALLDWSDVNTDLIIPARYLKKIERTGFGPLLFADKRYAPGGAPEADHPDEHGPEVADFPLNDPAFEGATRAGRRAELRLRLEPRTRRLGRDAGRLSRRHRPRQRRRLRRHLRVQRLTERPAGHRARRTRLAGHRRPRHETQASAEVTIDLREPDDHAPRADEQDRTQVDSATPDPFPSQIPESIGTDCSADSTRSAKLSCMTQAI